jgi:hypothetical protein
LNDTASKPITGYRVYMYNSALDGYVQVWQTASTSATITFANGELGELQRFQVAAYSSAVSSFNPGNILGEGVRSAIASGTPIAKPNAATDAALTARSDGGVTIDWALDPTAARPITEVLFKKDGTTTATLDNDDTSYAIDGLTPGTSYTFSIVPSNSVGNADTVTGSSVTVTAQAVPSAPNDFAVGLTGTEGRLRATWDAVTSTAARPVTGYRLFQYIGGGYVQIDQTSDTEALVNGLTLGTAYQFRIATYGSAGEGERS